MASPAMLAPGLAPPPSPPPAPSATVFNGDQVIATCANSSSPICYNTTLSGANMLTSLWFSAVLGALCLLGFVVFRAKFRFYQARLDMAQVTHKPPPMKMAGLHRIWSWLVPVFAVSDEELLLSAGMDALIAVRIISFGVLLLLPLTVVGLAVLVPVNYLDDYYAKQAKQDNVGDAYTTVFIRLTMSNITPRSAWLWVHFAYVYAAVFWTCWLITEHYKEYITLRQAYVVRATELPSTELGGSTGLLSPAALAPARSPQKRKHLLARATGGSGSSGGKPGRGKSGAAGGALRLPRRDASASSSVTDSGEGAGASAALVLVQAAPGAGSLGEFKAQRSRMSSAAPAPANGDTAAAQPHSEIELAGGGSGFGGLWQQHSPPPAAVAVAAAQRPPAGVPRHRSSGGASQGGPSGGGDCWTHHDFTVDLMPAASAPTTFVAASAAASRSAVPPLAVLPGGRGLFDPGADRPAAPLARMPSNAAVAAALEKGRTSSAAEALLKIKHHRQASGASLTPVPSHHTTPSATAASTPRADAPPPPPPPRQARPAPPPALAEVIRAVSGQEAIDPGYGGGYGGGEGGALSDDDYPDGLPTALALAPDLSLPQGQQGVAQRWWSALTNLGNRASTELRRASRQHVSFSAQSLTQKGAVAMALPPPRAGGIIAAGSPGAGGGGLLAANASLYTVLVTDQPVERLRLKRPLGNLEFWNPANRTQGDPLGLLATQTDEMDPSAPPPGAVGGRAGDAGAADAAERGLPRARGIGSSSAALRDGAAAEAGGGLAGALAWWRHRRRYAEWRRDVRWAMFNRRVRTATDMFTELFGDDFDAIVPIYPTLSVDRLIGQWDAAASRLECLQAALAAERPRGAEGDARAALFSRAPRPRRAARLKAQIAAAAAEVADLQAGISAERDATLSDLPSTCFFATFKSQEAAAVAAQANLNPVTSRLFNVEAAPSPDDVNWPALTRSWWQRQSRPAYVLPLILFIMLLPIGAFTGAFAQLTIALCGNPNDGDGGVGAGTWFCSADPLARFLRNLLTSLAPSLLLSLYHMCVLPVLVYYAAQAEGQCFSLSKLDRRCAELFFYWDVFNVFLGAMLGGSVLSELSNYVSNPGHIWATLSSAIPASSNFFINYVSYRALVMAWFRLFYPHQGIVTCILKWLRILPWAQTPRGRALEAPVRNCRYGRDVGIPVLMNFVMVMAYAVVSPLILPFGLLYFVLLWAVWRYQMLYVYQRQYESGGQMWPLVAHKVVGCAFIMVLFTAAVLVFKAAYTQAALLLGTLPLYLLRFDIYLTNRYDAVVAQVPLMAVHAAGRVRGVDPDLWTPPPLRQGAAGWNPEWGKVWQWWGVPRYTL